MLTKAMAYPMFRPEVDLHTSVDQEAMQHIFNESDFATGVLFQPRTWYNTYEFHHAYEGEKGNMLVHFPGLEDDRWSHMSKWLSVVENYPDEWDVAYERTKYPKNVTEYWDVLRDGIITLNKGEKIIGEKGDQAEGVEKDVIDRLKSVVLFEADSVAGVRTATREAKEQMPQLTETNS